MTDKYEVGLIAFANITAIADTIYLGRGMTHFLNNGFDRKNAFFRQFKHTDQGELDHWHTRHCFQGIPFFLAEQVGCMIGSNDIDNSGVDCIS